jgi:hypothetical protein
MPAQGEAMITAAKTAGQQFDTRSRERPKRRTAIDVSRRNVIFLLNCPWKTTRQSVREYIVTAKQSILNTAATGYQRTLQRTSHNGESLLSKI